MFPALKSLPLLAILYFFCGQIPRVDTLGQPEIRQRLLDILELDVEPGITEKQTVPDYMKTFYEAYSVITKDNHITKETDNPFLLFAVPAHSYEPHRHKLTISFRLMSKEYSPRYTSAELVVPSSILPPPSTSNRCIYWSAGDCRHVQHSRRQFSINPNASWDVFNVTDFFLESRLQKNYDPSPMIHIRHSNPRRFPQARTLTSPDEIVLILYTKNLEWTTFRKIEEVPPATLSMEGNTTEETDSSTRQKRGSLLSRVKRDQGNCHLESFTVSFEELGWGWILSPLSFNASICLGTCPDPLTKDSPLFRNHAYLRRLYGIFGNEVVPGACCVPYQLKGLNLMYKYFDNTVLSHLEELIPTQCACF